MWGARWMGASPSNTDESNLKGVKMTQTVNSLDEGAPATPGLVTVEAAANELGVCTRTVRNMIDAGELDAYRIRGRRCIRVARSSIEAALIPVGPLPAPTTGKAVGA